MIYGAIGLGNQVSPARLGQQLEKVSDGAVRCRGAAAELRGDTVMVDARELDPNVTGVGVV